MYFTQPITAVHLNQKPTKIIYAYE